MIVLCFISFVVFLFVVFVLLLLFSPPRDHREAQAAAQQRHGAHLEALAEGADHLVVLCLLRIAHEKHLPPQADAAIHEHEPPRRGVELAPAHLHPVPPRSEPPGGAGGVGVPGETRVGVAGLAARAVSRSLYEVFTRLARD